MNNATSAAIGANLAELGNTAMRMFDPSTRREALLAGNNNALLAAQLSGQNIENQYRPGLFAGQTAAANADAAARLAAAGLSDEQKKNFSIRNAFGNQMLADTTSYSQGSNVGGRDEMQDSWTNKGYTATGPNLSDGVAAIGKGGKYKIGDIIKAGNNIMIAADYHGNKNPDVIDIYRSGNNYQGQSGQMPVTVLGHEPIKYGTTAEQLAATRARYERQAALSNGFNGGGANDLMQANAIAAALSAGTEEDARRAGLARTGNGFSAGENFTQARSDAYHAAQLEKDLNVELIKQTGAIQRDLVGTGGGKSILDTSKGMEELDNMALSRFAMGEGKDAVITDQTREYATLWKANVAQYTQAGVPFATAVAMADQANPSSAIKKNEGGWFSSPSVTVGPEWRNQLVTAEEAAQAALPYARQVGGLTAAGGFTMPPTEAAPQAVGSTPPAAVPQTGVTAADAFTRRQGSKEKAAADVKKKQISEVEARLRDVTRNLETGNQNLSSPSPFSAAGASRGYMPTQPPAAARVQPMDNDTYNLRLDEYHALNKQLNELKGSPAPAQGGTQVGRFIIH